MKIALSTTGNSLEAPLEPRFGRSPRFLVFDTETQTCALLDNGDGRQAAHGAGIQAAQMVARSGATVVITGQCGPKAMNVLAAAGVQVHRADCGTVATALADYQAGRLPAQGASGGNG